MGKTILKMFGLQNLGGVLRDVQFPGFLWSLKKGEQRFVPGARSRGGIVMII